MPLWSIEHVVFNGFVNPLPEIKLGLSEKLNSLSLKVHLYWVSYIVIAL